MDYQVWIKDETYQLFDKVDCGDKEAAMWEIDKAVRSGQEPLLTLSIPYKLSIKLEEDKIGEVQKSKTKPDQSARGKGDSEVRRGDEADTPGLD